MANDDLKKSRVKCKCGSTTVYLNELWKDHVLQFEQTDGVFDRVLGIQEVGNPYKVEALCRTCGHMWTVRGALQIEDVIKQP